MKNGIAAIICLSLALSCSSDSEPIDAGLTGKQLSYPLYQSSEFNVSGSVLIQEKIDGATRFTIELKGLSGDGLVLPVHLHSGAIDVADAVLVAQLNPMNLETGKSITDINQLADETPITYLDFLQYAGSIKVHLSDAGRGGK